MTTSAQRCSLIDDTRQPSAFADWQYERSQRSADSTSGAQCRHWLEGRYCRDKSRRCRYCMSMTGSRQGHPGLCLHPCEAGESASGRIGCWRCRLTQGLRRINQPRRIRLRAPNKTETGDLRSAVSTGSQTRAEQRLSKSGFANRSAVLFGFRPAFGLGLSLGPLFVVRVLRCRRTRSGATPLGIWRRFF